MSSPRPRFNTPKRRLALIILALGLLAAAVGGIWVLTHDFGAGAARTMVHLENQPQFKVKRNHKMLGVDIMQITDKREPQEFLVLNNVPQTMVEPLFGKPVDVQWANMVANQFLKTRDPESSEPPPAVEIQEVKTLHRGTIAYEGRNLPYWHVQIQFRLAHETEPRYYEAGILRNVTPAAGQADTLVIAYAQKGAYRRELMPELLEHLAFEPNR